MRYVLLLFLFVSCSSRPLYSFNEVVLFKHADPLYDKKCSSVGTIFSTYIDKGSYVYTIGNVTCQKSELDFTKVTVDVPESHIHKVVL